MSTFEGCKIEGFYFWWEFTGNAFACSTVSYENRKLTAAGVSAANWKNGSDEWRF